MNAQSATARRRLQMMVVLAAVAFPACGFLATLPRLQAVRTAVARAVGAGGGDISVNLTNGRHLTIAVTNTTRAGHPVGERGRAQSLARIAYAAYDLRSTLETITVTFPTVGKILLFVSISHLGDGDVFRFQASDLVEAAGRDQPVAPPPERRSLYLVPIDDIWPDLVPRIAARLRLRFPMPVTVLPGLPLSKTAYDDDRDQVVAETLIADIQERHAALLREPGARIVAVTADDMYIRTEDWQFALSLRNSDDRVAVVSYARLGAELSGNAPDETLLESRVRKMVIKNVGVLCYGFPLSKNPRSVLYGSIGGVDELDLMTEEFAPAD